MTIQLRTLCPGCGEFTAIKKVERIARYEPNDRKGHLITLTRPANSIAIYCPVQDSWFIQDTFLEPNDLLPDGQQLALL